MGFSMPFFDSWKRRLQDRRGKAPKEPKRVLDGALKTTAAALPTSTTTLSTANVEPCPPEQAGLAVSAKLPPTPAKVQCNSLSAGHSPPKDGASDTPQSLWDCAYAALRSKDSALVENYEKVLSRELKTDSGTPGRAQEYLDDTDNLIDNDPTVRREQLNKIIEAGRQRMGEKKIKYHIAGYEFVLQDQIAQAAELVQWGKALVDEALKASPEASMAWCGICLVLPLLTRPKDAEDANTDGLAYVTARIRFYAALEPLLLPKHPDSAAAISADLKKAFENNVVDLYQQVLEFQFRSVLRFFRGRLRNLGRDLIQREDWSGMLSKVQELEKTLDGDFKKINDSVLRRKLEEINESAKGSLGFMRGLLSVAEEHLRVDKELLQLHKDTAKQAMSDKENECHQLFRLTKNNNAAHELYGDATYEWYKDRVEDRVEGTCQWFLSHEHFRTWLEQDSGPLLVSADPGCGKSVLAKYLIDHGLPRSATVCYFFFKDQDQNTIRQALCAMLHQLFSHQPSLIRHAMPEYSKNGPGLTSTTASLWEILERAGQDSQAEPVILVLDALDECVESDFRDLIRMLKRLFRGDKQSRGKMRCLLTTRPYGHIVSEFEELVDAFPYIRIPGEEESETISQEVNRVIEYRVEQLAKERRLSKDIKDHIAQRLLRVPHRTYLWVYLVFDYLKASDFKKTKRGIESIIAVLPESVNQAYEKILDKSKEPSMVRKVLSIILAASRPLTLAEMNIAVNIDISSRSVKDLDLEGEEDFKLRLRSWCGLFVSIYHGRVYFLHQTAREFLLANLSPARVPSEPRWHCSITTRHAHAVLAEVCVTYLNLFNSDAILTNDGESGQCIGSSTLFGYSAKNWAAHFREAKISNGAAIVSSALSICDPDSKSYPAWFQIYTMTRHGQYPEHSTSLGIASCLGLKAVSKLLLDKGADIEAEDEYGRTPLLLAILFKYEAVVRLLLDEGADIEAKKKFGQTPLSTAILNGYKTIVELLLNKGADIEAKNESGQTPLLLAAFTGNETVVELLLDRGANIEAKDKFGWTSLSIAALYKREAVVELLLDRGADIEAKDEWSDAALAVLAQARRQAAAA
ncbi:hypothetical protein DL766_003956 [Monosporascus sp. MC13-8B]|uniref:NWD NACHT-NTPase N-terminal domain-containing protein n=1 Tax=Monosporascus cannonballus TaxID=155416 RepID=A0ABY0H660_9PEZI|nr:hypothetical protein DL762_004991 [Monosporascus cannonballus]RYO96451.1 hypothetical protein DL763_003200 [Monosporascus cannonballus]RYP32468.1 hypothetical protein DL766_003956 [Monosporascus sp. MC13-8B]